MAESTFFGVVGREPWELRGANDARIRDLQTDLAAAQTDLDTAEALLYAPTYLLTGGFPIGSTNSASFVNMPGPPTKTLTKLRADTYFVVHGHCSAYKSGSANYIDLGINFNGVDHWMARLFFNTLSQHQDIVIAGHLGTAAPAGNHLVTVRWRTGSADAVVDTNDFYHLTFREGYVA